MCKYVSSIKDKLLYIEHYVSIDTGRLRHV